MCGMCRGYHQHQYYLTVLLEKYKFAAACIYVSKSVKSFRYMGYGEIGRLGSAS